MEFFRNLSSPKETRIVSYGRMTLITPTPKYYSHYSSHLGAQTLSVGKKGKFAENNELKHGYL